MRQSLFLYTNNERGRIPAPSDNSVNLPFTSAYILFLSVRPEYRDVSLHPHLFILFRAAEKERIKKKAAARNSHSFENVRHC